MSSEKRSTILVVDDDESGRHLVGRTLQSEHRVLLAENGRRALETLDAEPVDLVILDVMLPDMPGFEVCRSVKARTREAYLPVLLLSGLDEQADRNAGLAAGADDYLVKPFDRNELRMRVKKFLELRDRDRAHRSSIVEGQKMQDLKDDLVALIAHDLRNPLSAIQGNLDLLHNLTTNPEYGMLSGRVQKAIASTGELRAILDSLLEVRLLEEQRLPLQVAPTPLRAMMDEAIATIEGAATARRVSLELDVEHGAVATVDRRLILRAMGNLLSNAIRHSPPGSVVGIRARQSGGVTELSVADRGPGVSDELKPRLFQKFATSSADGQRRGYGLGLYLVRLVAEAHSGEVSVTDHDGGGAVFTVSLSV